MDLEDVHQQFNYSRWNFSLLAAPVRPVFGCFWLRQVRESVTAAAETDDLGLQLLVMRVFSSEGSKNAKASALLSAPQSLSGLDPSTLYRSFINVIFERGITSALSESSSESLLGAGFR